MVEISTAAIQKHGKQNTGRQNRRAAEPQNTPQRSAGGRMQDAGAAGQRAEISIAAIQKHGKQNTGRQNHRAAEHTAAEHRRQNARQENTGFALPNRLKMRRIGTVAFWATTQGMRLAAEQRWGTVGHRETGHRPEPEHHGNGRVSGSAPEELSTKARLLFPPVP